MIQQDNNYELLATYLEPRFGNIYEYNLEEGQVAGYDFQAWTDELRDAVKQYLLHELPTDVWDWLIEPEEMMFDGIVSKEVQVDTLIERLDPGSIALAVRNAAVCNVPTLHQLIGGRDVWNDEDDKWNAIVWLEAHKPSNCGWTELASVSHHRELFPVIKSRYPHAPLSEDLVQALTPPELLAAWDYVFGPAPSDLTDEEWQLLEPHFGPSGRWSNVNSPRPRRELDTKRRIFNAIRFKAAYHMPWSHLPLRYGKGRSVYHAYCEYRDGLFARLRDALKDNPEAERIVEWLEQMINTEGLKSRQT